MHPHDGHHDHGCYGREDVGGADAHCDLFPTGTVVAGYLRGGFSVDVVQRVRKKDVVVRCDVMGKSNKRVLSCYDTELG